ncbi:hypothetical protein F7725_027794 [Dissostichus mawsoni]|uniref:Thromboxane A2 receptor n=1 Tax=Dissostichus mawsoni TaxID=36200 RepID=A0A7J5XDX3_DISMA|nr:hypothetical protein F7725_027794 [Dissostichus mawsoni]
MNASSFANNTPLCYSINSPPFEPIPNASAYFSSIFSTLGLTSNFIAFVVLLKSFRRTHSRSRSFFMIFLGGLVVTDFMGLLVTGSIVVSYHVTHFNWRTLDPNCNLCNFMGMSMVFYGLCPLMLGTAMAIERFIGINHPFAHSSSMPKSRTVFMVLMVLHSFAAPNGHWELPHADTWILVFFNISSKGNDFAFSLIFSLLGLMSITVSFLLNTVSIVTLIKVCCGEGKNQRRRDHEIEMMVQLILIMVIASSCWCPLLVFIVQTVLSGGPLQIKYLLLWLRFATFNQILDPWSRPRLDWSRSSIMSLTPFFGDTVRRFTRSSLRSTMNQETAGDRRKSNLPPPSP